MPHSHIHYLNHALNRELSELYVSTLIRGFAIGMLALYTPLYFFKEGWSVQHIVLWFAINYAVFGLLTPLGAKITVHFGHEKAMALSEPKTITTHAPTTSIGPYHLRPIGVLEKYRKSLSYGHKY